MNCPSVDDHIWKKNKKKKKNEEFISFTIPSVQNSEGKNMVFFFSVSTRQVQPTGGGS